MNITLTADNIFSYKWYSINDVYEIQTCFSSM